MTPDGTPGTPDGTASRQEFRKDLGRRLAAVLDEFQDRREAARVAGCAERQLEDCAAGRRLPSFEALARLAAHTGVSLDWIASGAGPVTRAAAPRTEGPPGHVPSPERADAGIAPEVLAVVIRMVLDALEEERLELYSFALAELVSLVYVAVSEADAKAEASRADVVEIARDNLRRLLPLVTAGAPR